MSAVVAMLEHCQNSCWESEGAWLLEAARVADAADPVAAPTAPAPGA